MPGIFIPNFGCNFLVPHQLLRNRFFFFLNACHGKALFHIGASKVQEEGETDKVKTADRNKSNEVETY